MNKQRQHSNFQGRVNINLTYFPKENLASFEKEKTEGLCTGDYVTLNVSI